VASLVAVSPHTRAAYAHDAREFVAWAERGGCPTPERLDRRALRRYLAYLDTRGFARSSIARKAAAVRSYLRWLRRRGMIATDPGRGLRAPKGASRLPR
jgi:site-specific recombinase XerC